MATYSRPGVYIQEVPLPQSVTPADNSAAVGAFLGSLPKGNVTAPVFVSTWAEFVSTFGGLNDSYPTTWAAYNFFANGGRNAYVKRVTGTGATAGAITIMDGASTPAAAFTLTAKNPGTWINDYSVQIVSAGSGTSFGLDVYVSTTVNGNTTSSLVESYTDLKMDSTNTYYVGAVITSRSNLFKISAINSAKTPVVMSNPSAITSGANGTTPVRADYVWSTFDSVLSSLVMYNPDAAYAASTLSTQLHGDALLYAGTRTDAFVVVDTNSGLTVTDAQTQVTAIAAGGASATSGNIAAAYYPWYSIPDTTKVPGATRLQAPGAGMVGQYISTDALRGPFKTPAGLNNQLALAISTEHLFTNVELDTINTSADPINAIRSVPGAGIVVMGGRTLDNTPNNRYINIRRSLIFIEKQLSQLTEFAVFENNDSRLWSQIRTSLNSFLLNYWQAGGLRGASPTQAYFVKCDDTTTSFSDIQSGRVNIEVGVALEYPAEFVVIKLGQLTGNATA